MYADRDGVTGNDRRRANNRRHYQKNKHVYIARNKRRDAKRREFLRDLKEASPCMDCGGVFHFTAMEFDHRPDEVKKFNVSDISRPSSQQDLLNEIAKCDLVCANCHRVRTYTRSQEVARV